jgi:hypothetical protein
MASSKYATFKKTTDTYGTDYYLAFFVPKDVHFALKMAQELLEASSSPELLHIGIGNDLVTLQVTRGQGKKLTDSDIKMADSLLEVLKDKDLILSDKDIAEVNRKYEEN